jgi:hypothetical protein
MRYLPFVVALLLAPVVFDVFPEAWWNREVVVNGIVNCGKCDRQSTSNCVDVVEARSRDRAASFYLVSYESEECGTTSCRDGIRKVRVRGLTFRKDGKRWIAPTQIETISQTDSSGVAVSTKESRRLF